MQHPVRAVNLISQLQQAGFDSCFSSHMSEPSSPVSQTHPLEAIDRDHIDRLLSRETPSDGDLADLARLLIRYDGFPGAESLQQDMERLLTLWNINREQLNAQVRQIWASGYRPGSAVEESVGSGFDTSQSDGG